MYFSGMAMSVLAQSVPLFAVGHLAGWKTREERSWWLQRRRLRDALLMGDEHAKKGMLFEKRAGVHNKQDDLLEKKRDGSAHLVEHDSAWSDDRSDDCEALIVECDPLSKVTDSGIYGCGMDSHCVESEESELGGFCVPSKQQASSIRRALQAGYRSCVAGPNDDGSTCDCSQFNSTTGVGTFSCSGGASCPGTTCTYDADGLVGIELCSEFDEATVIYSPLESYCASSMGYYECEIKANGIACNSCELYDEEKRCYAFDCTNTVMNVQGTSCDGSIGALKSFLDTKMESKSTAPSASPSKSSGSSPTAKATIVVSASAAAWMASFSS